MSCPECGCKVTYQYDSVDDPVDDLGGYELLRCANCGAIFDELDASTEVQE